MNEQRLKKITDKKGQVRGEGKVLPVISLGSSFFAFPAGLMFWGGRADTLSHLYSRFFSAPLSARPCATGWNRGPEGWFLAGSSASRPGTPAFLSWCAQQSDVSGLRGQRSSPVAQLPERGLSCTPPPGLHRVTVKIRYKMQSLSTVIQYKNCLNNCNVSLNYKIFMQDLFKVWRTK